MSPTNEPARSAIRSDADELGQSSGDRLRLPDEEIFGRYRLLARIGRGGMADVFLGLSPGPRGLSKPVVVKRIKDSDGDAAMNRMFLDEARIAARLSHPNVVHTYEVGEHDSDYFIVMELLAGQPLRGVAKLFRETATRLPPELVAYVVREALLGLHYAHELEDYDGTPLEIVHRDVSPQNIFVTYEGIVKVVDFGIAKSRGSSETEDGVLKGKVAYMSPEQALAGKVDRRTDIFAMGIVMWELVTNRRLFSEANTTQVLVRLVNEAIPPPSAVSPHVDAELDAIVSRALSRAVDERYPTAEAMVKDLNAYLAEHPFSASEAAALLGKYFSKERDEMRALLQECMTRPTSLESSQYKRLSAGLFSDSGDVRAQSRSGASAVTGAQDRSTRSRRENQTRVRRVGLWAVAAVLLAGIAGLALRGAPATSRARADVRVEPAPPPPRPAPPSAETAAGAAPSQAPPPASSPAASAEPPHAAEHAPSATTRKNPVERRAPLAPARPSDPKAPAPLASPAASTPAVAPSPALPTPPPGQPAGRKPRTIDSDFPGQ